MMHNEMNQFAQPMLPYRGLSQPPPVDLRNQLGIHDHHLEEEKERDYMPPKQYYPTCNCQKTVLNVRYNPYGYYYAPANILFSPKSLDSEDHSKKRNRKHKRKSRERHYHKSNRTKSAYVGNTIPLQIVPTMKDNRVLLHAYPMEEEYSHNEHPRAHKERESSRRPPTYIQKLEYSSSKKSSRYRSSDKKKKHNLEMEK